MSESYPNLAQLIGGYFHQDAYDEFETDAQIFAAYRSTISRQDVAATIADIERFTARHPTGLNAAFMTTFQPDYGIGDNDDEARDWLKNAIRELQIGL